MAITQADFNIDTNPNPLKVVLGKDGELRINFSNTSTTERGYNLTTSITIPDGVSYVSSSIEPTSIIENSDDTITINWLNIKDLAPNEVDFSIGVSLKSDEMFRETGDPVQFDVPLESIDVSATVDTLPRGDDDTGNQKITKNESLDFIPLRYNLLKTGPGKIPKGAGLITPTVSPRWPYEYKLTVINNTREPSTVILVDNLPNGVRYLDNLNVLGPDASTLSNPTVITPSPGIGCQDFVTLDWGSVVISEGSINIITFDSAVWDNFTTNCVENSGSRIPHMTPLQNIAKLDGLSGPVEVEHKVNAMDATINKSVQKKQTDVGEINTYTLTYRINQYDDVGLFTIEDIVSDGQSYNLGSASITPDSIVPQIDGTTQITWILGLAQKGSTGSITFTTTVDILYSTGDKVAADDELDNNVDISGTNQTTLTSTPDSSSASVFIDIPNINKEILGYFYKDGTPKTFDIVAPGDNVRFEITYDATNIEAAQLNVEIDEFAPINMGPLISSLPISYGGTVPLPSPFTPVTVSPNGLRWSLGNVGGRKFWTATFDVPVQNIDFVGARNNLAKLAGRNTEGFSYSDRDQVLVEFGEPNVMLDKTVTGPDIDAIKAGEVYTYSITISNPQSSEGTVTDAFELDLTDVIPDKLSYLSGSATVTGTGDFDPPVITGQDVSMTILKLAPNESLTLSFDVLVDFSIVAGEKFENNAVLQRPYSQPDRTYQFPGTPLTDSTTLKAKAIIVNKIVDPTFAKIGDRVTYIIDVTVPEGTTAFNVQLKDVFLDSKQDFIIGSATLDGVGITPQSVVGGIVTFAVISFIDATIEAITKTYSFDVRITDADQAPPYIENQTDDATVSWDVDSSGTPAVPVSDSVKLKVRTPFIVGVKEQRNVTKDTLFTTRTTNYEVGDIIEYKITLTNEGKATAFNIEYTDELDSLLEFVSGSIITTKGSATESGGIITWNIDGSENIPPNETATLTFRVETLQGVASAGRVDNQGSFTYDSNNNGFEVSYGPDDTNKVRLRSAAVTIDKTTSLTQGEIGDDIDYTLTIKVPDGTIAYDLTVDDFLPVGQTYQIGTAKRQEPPSPPESISVSQVGQLLTLGDPITIDATGGERTILYTFTARITQANINPPYTEQQIDTGRVRWALEPSGSLNRTRTDEWSIIARTPHIDITKKQRNASLSGAFTKENISGLPGEEIQYEIKIDSNGASPAFNVNLEDIVDSRLTFDRVVSGPTEGTITSTSPLTWEISQLDNGTSATVVFAVTINGGVGSGAEIPDNASAEYDSNDVNPVTFDAESNTVVLDIPLLGFTKIASTSVAAIGETITYTLTVTIPDGVVAYNIRICDCLPPEQSYVMGSWNPGSVTVIDNHIRFEDSASFRTGPDTLTFTFDAVVDAGNTNEPYTEMQRNTSNLGWDVSLSGPSKIVDNFSDVEVRAPHITVLKEQRKQGEANFTTEVLQGIETDDIVEYRITITNDGANTAFNIITMDTLDAALTYIEAKSPLPPGTIIHPTPAGTPNGTVTWTEDELIVGNSLSLIFSVKVNSGPAPGDAIFNQAQSVYDTSQTNPTTLGPEKSNQVGFNFTLPEIEKTVNQETAFVGDRIEYTAKITIPNGNFAYDVQVSDVLPNNQSYVIGTLKKNGTSITPLSLSPFIFESPQDVDATSGAVTILYTFEADINSITDTPEDIQTNTSTIKWNKQPQGDPGDPQSDDANVFVTDFKPNIQKKQKNFTQNPSGSFTTNLISASVGDNIYYEYNIENTSTTNTIYAIRFEDELNTFISFDSIIQLPTGGTVIQDGNKIKATLNKLDPGNNANFVVAYTVTQGAGAQSRIPNTFMVVYDVNDTDPIREYGPIKSNEVELELSNASIEKLASIDEAEIGEIFTYTVNVTVPNGTIAYNLVVKDILPSNQIYIGEAKVDSTLVFPIMNGSEVIFDPITIDASNGEKTVVFSFKARVVKGNMMSPYTEIQTNEVEVGWEIDTEGNKATPLTDTKDIIVNSPFFFIKKDQRNITKDTAISVEPVPVELGDVVEFRIIAHNTGEASAYNIRISDELGQFKEFISFESIPIGNASYNPTTDLVNWEIDELEKGVVEALVFRIRILQGVPAGGEDTNIATGFYDTNAQNPITFGPKPSNDVVQKFPNVQIEKTADILRASIGDIITYTVKFILPKGTLIYNGQFIDIIPIGQEYNNNATLNGNPIIAQKVEGQLVTFPVVPFAEAFDEDLVFTYTFEVKVISADVDSITLIDIQRNDAEGKWEIEPGKPAPRVNDTEDIKVTNSSIKIEKEQKNTSLADEFTKKTIDAFTGDIINLKLVVTNTGPNTVYDIIVFDQLSSDLSFVEVAQKPSQTTVNHSGEKTNGIVEWQIPALDSNESVILIFSVKVLREFVGDIVNFAEGSFRITSQNPNRFGEPNSNTTEIHVKGLPFEIECIITDKIYSQCRSRRCFDNIDLNIPEGYSFQNIVFNKGIIVPGSLIINKLVSRPNFRRVKLMVKVSYKIIFINDICEKLIQIRDLPQYNIDIIIYMPETRNEQDFNITIDTLSELLKVNDENETFAVGIFNIISVMLRVQLLIPAYGYCDIPPICEEYKKANPCDDFIDNNINLMQDFYPEQYE